MKAISRIFSFATAIALTAAALCSCGKSQPVSVLIVSGQNNHNWPVSHKALELIYNQSGLFHADIALTPEKGGDMSTFRPEFGKYDAVVLDYNGDDWCEETRQAFLDYVNGGGGVVIYHAADNAFTGWDEFNRIIALGGWCGRDEKSGPYCYLEDGRLVKDFTTTGPGGNHGKRREYPMHCRNSHHPVTEGLPDNWMHAEDELYDSMRGPANIGELLYSGRSDAATGGSGREEPLVFTVDYGDARIFHIMIGHCGPDLENNPAMQCAGFQTLLLRGTEWAATGKVTGSVPEDFPTASAVSLRKDYRSSI